MVSALAAASLSVMALSPAGLAQARRTPRVSLLVSAKQTAGNPVHFTYSVSGATRKSAVVFQRQGTGGQWRTVKTLKRRSGNGVAPAFSIGEYAVRLAVLRSGRVQAQKSQQVFVYGDIPFSNICNASNVEWGNSDRGCASGTSEVGQFLFQSAATFDAPGSSNATAPAVNLTITPSTSCRSMHLDFGESNADNQHAGGNMMITQSVIQSQTPPSDTTFSGGVLQHIDLTLDGGPVQITDESSTAGTGTLEVLENGTLNCYTPDGVVPGSEGSGGYGGYGGY
jgi:hypothetical protein